MVQAWVSPDLARDLKQLAEQERRSVSAVIRLAIEDQLRKEGATPVSESFELPYRDEADMTIEVVDVAREVLEDDELRVVEQLAYDAMVRGVTTVGELLSEMEAAGPGGRRQIVDQARIACGLATLEDEAAHQRFLETNAAIRGTGRDSRARRSNSASIVPPSVRPRRAPCDRPRSAARHCDEHRPLAEEGDLDPPDDPMPRLDLATMQLLPSKAEEEKLRARTSAAMSSSASRTSSKSARLKPWTPSSSATRSRPRRSTSPVSGFAPPTVGSSISDQATRLHEAAHATAADLLGPSRRLYPG